MIFLRQTATGLILFILSTTMASASAGAADKIAPFIISDVSAEHSVSDIKPVAFFSATAKSLMVKGRTKAGEKVFSFYEMLDSTHLSGTPTLTVPMPHDALFYDLAPVFGKEQSTLLFLGSDGVQRYNPATDALEPIMAVSSIYRRGASPLFEQLNFARDLNGDGFADIIVPDFEGYRLRLNDGKGSFGTETLLDMQVEMRLSNRRPLYSQFPLLNEDVNFDGQKDIVFLKDRSFIAFLQNPDGSFDATPTVFDIGLDIIGNSFDDFIKSEERYQDQSDLSETSISLVKDMNGDGILDIVTLTDRAQGLFKRSSTYQFHYGVEAEGRLVFNKTPDTEIKLDGVTARNKHIDFNDDGRIDFAGGAVNIGIGKIIGILLSGSVGIRLISMSRMKMGIIQPNQNSAKKCLLILICREAKAACL